MLQAELKRLKGRKLFFHNWLFLLFNSWPNLDDVFTSWTWTGSRCEPVYILILKFNCFPVSRTAFYAVKLLHILERILWSKTKFAAVYSRFLSPLPPPVKFVIPWPEIMRLERVSTGLMPEAIRVSTRQRQRDFSMFLSLDEAFGVISQLADIALRRLLDSEGLELDRVLQQPARITKRWLGESALCCLVKLSVASLWLWTFTFTLRFCKPRDGAAANSASTL